MKKRNILVIGLIAGGLMLLIFSFAVPRSYKRPSQKELVTMKLPDLRPAEIIPYPQLTLVKVENIGEATAPGPVKVVVVRIIDPESNNPVVSMDFAQTQTNLLTSQDIPAGGSHNVSVNMGIGEAPQGAKYLFSTGVDYNNEIPESNEDNNQLTGNFEY